MKHLLLWSAGALWLLPSCEPTLAQVGSYNVACHLENNTVTQWHVDGVCSFRPHGNGDFDITTRVPGQGNVFASVYVSVPRESASGLWGYVGKPIGALYANGPCWENESVRICAWRPGEAPILPVSRFATAPAYVPPPVASYQPPPMPYAPPPGPGAVYGGLPQSYPGPAGPTVYPRGPVPMAPPAPTVALSPSAPANPSSEPEVTAPTIPAPTGFASDSSPAQASGPSPVGVGVGSPVRQSIPIDISEDGHTMTTRLCLGSSTYVTAMVDTGATHTSVPESIALALVAKGEASFVDFGSFKLADGHSMGGMVIKIGIVRLGGVVLHDVLAGTAPNGANVLLGISALDQLGKFTADKANRQIVFG